MSIKSGLLMVALMIVLANGQDYCELGQKYCKGSGHIACSSTVFPSGDCQNVQVLPMTEEYKNLILKRHNDYRSQVAQGKVHRFPEAVQMNEIVWDDDLAYVALKNVEHCIGEHDNCHVTNEFHTPGQSLSFAAETIANNSYVEILNALVDEWFDEYKKASVSITRRVTNADVGRSGHFTLLAKDKNEKIGCGVIDYEYDDPLGHWYAHRMTCDYSSNNFLNEPAYVPGPACSKCADVGKECSTTYPGLCAAK